MSSVLATPPSTLGRFHLRRQLGQGAQATVWLAHDPRLDRDVALKLLRDGEDAVIGDWLSEARAVSRLTHPNIVPVFEADTQDGQPYMVFEYVPGATLSERLRQRGPIPVREAVGMMLGVLEALSAAHAAGLVHRDLKPSNILLDANGRARVMDFGIAARVQDGGADRRIVGTPGYMSPEAARGDPPSAQMDVFAAGVMLTEMLAGAPLLRERDPYRAIERVIREDLALPESLPADVDDTLRALLRRAIARDPSARLPDAATFREGLASWLNPAPPESGGESGRGALDFLLRRMRHKSDFPAMSDSIARIQRVAGSEKESLGSLSNEILKDVALTNKLLRLVNTAQFRHAGGGTISTVSRAVALVGFAGIRNMALSLVLLEHMQDKGHAGQLKEEFLRSLMAGSIAGELADTPREGEEVFIGAMFQNLGRLLAQYYFPEEARQVRAMTQGGPPLHGQTASAGTTSEAAASVSVLGLSYEELGLGIAKHWGLPEGLLRCMSRPVGDPPARPGERDRARWLANAANDVADALLLADPSAASACISEVASRCGRPLGFDEKLLRAAAERARERLVQTASAMKIHVAASSPARRLLEAAPTLDFDLPTVKAAAAPAVSPAQPGTPTARASRVGAAAPSSTATASDILEAHTLQVTMQASDPATLPGRAADTLAAGIQDITAAMVSDTFNLTDTLRTILEVMYRALGFRRVMLCLRDPKTTMLAVRVSVGDCPPEVSAAFRVASKSPAQGAPDLFTAVVQRGVDTLISDASASSIASRLPAWFRDKTGAPTFLLLPLSVKGSPFGLIYADKPLPGTIEIGEKELNLLRTLRNQALMAFRQTS